MVKIEIEVKDAIAGGSWKELYDCHATDPQTWAKKLIGRFNATLRSGENPREVVNVKVLGDSITKDHVWRKVNAVTIIRGSRNYDKVRCECCGITGKRFGVGGITRDSMYKAKKYIKCHG